MSPRAHSVLSAVLCAVTVYCQSRFFRYDDGIRDAYFTGRGSIKMRAVTEIEKRSNGKNRIVVTELPYQVNKARLVERIAELVRDKTIDGITDLRDESDRDGLRIAIDLKRDVNPTIILNLLLKHTAMQDTFGVIMLALVDGKPKVMNLKEVLTHYIHHQEEVITRRTQFDLKRAQARAHILEGLTKAIVNLDSVIKIVRNSGAVADARDALITYSSSSSGNFGFAASKINFIGTRKN